MKDLVWLDLCSGLGGASQPALDRGWKVIRVDIDPRFKPDIVADLTNPPKELFALDVDVAWASPVCTEFTKAGLPKSWACNRLNPAKPDTALSEACWELIWAVGDWPILENVAAARPYLTPLFGPVQGRVDGHCFWGKLPGLLPQTHGHKWRLPPSPDRAAIRAQIPYAIGEAICRAVEARALNGASPTSPQLTHSAEAKRC